MRILDEENWEDISFIRGYIGAGRVKTDASNTSNHDNLNSIPQIVDGVHISNAYRYLLNMGFTGLSDAKSIGFYNSGNLAAKISYYRSLEEIHDESTIKLIGGSKRTSRLTRAGLGEVLEHRHSARQFVQHTMSFEEFSYIMHFSFGLSKREMLYDGIVVSTRHYGSGGGLYPIEVIIIVDDVSNVVPGIYKYQPYSHTLYPLNHTLDVEHIFQQGSLDLKHFSFVVLYKYDLNRNIEKYGDLSLAITFIEIGLMSQNLCLVYTSIGYSGCQIAGFDKHYCEQQLGLDGLNSHILFSDLCGHE